MSDGAALAVEVRGLVKRYRLQGGMLRKSRTFVEAVSGVGFEIPKATTLGLVGESGSGKSTIARLIMRLVEPTAGTICIDGIDTTSLRGADLRRTRRAVQMVFQDPFSSFDPFAPVGRSVGEPLWTHLRMPAAEREKKVAELFGLVGLPRPLMAGRPSEFSGGQLQRAAIARALTTDPEVLVLDEPVSALDVSTQAQVINLLDDLKHELGITYLFIAHDLSVVRHVSDRIAVMYLGRIVEEGPSEAVYAAPGHPYTEALLSAVPLPDPQQQRTRQRVVLAGDIPSPTDPPSGCRFRTRCPYAMDVCASEEPPAFQMPTGTTVHCFLHTHGPRLRGASVTTLRGAPAAPASERP